MLFVATVSAQSVTLDAQDAEVWLRGQTLRGSVSSEDGTEMDNGIVYVENEAFPFHVEGGAFEVEVLLGEGGNDVVALTRAKMNPRD